MRYERFNTAERRSLNAIDRIELMAAILKNRSRADWLDRLDRADVPCAPVLRREEIVYNPQVIANGLLEILDQPGVGKIPQTRPPPIFSGTPPRIPGPPPPRAGPTPRRFGERSSPS